MACISNVLIVGGGVAGLSSAVALSRAGVRCEVVEMSHEGPLGSAFGLSARAPEALDELGVYDELYALSKPFDQTSTASSLRNAAGEVISAGPPPPDWPGAKIALGVHRPTLAKLLTRTALEAGATIRKGMTIDAIEEGDDGALVTLSDGSKSRWDLVLGADGIRSKTRSLVFPEAPKPAYSGQISIRWMAPGEPIEGEGWYIGPVGKLGFYQLPQGSTYAAMVLDMPELRRLTAEDVYALVERLLDSYTAPAIVELRRRLSRESTLWAGPFEWLLIGNSWHRGHTLLIGDAAHATTAHLGMGGGMALEDSVVLAQCVKSESTLAAALDTFMARRFERVRTVVETSVKLSQLEQAKAPTPELMKIMGAAFRVLAQPY